MNGVSFGMVERLHAQHLHEGYTALGYVVAHLLTSDPTYARAYARNAHVIATRAVGTACMRDTCIALLIDRGELASALYLHRPHGKKASHFGGLFSFHQKR